MIQKYLKKIGRGIANNIILSMCSKGIAMIFFLLTDIFTARILSVNGYGEWSFFYSLISMIYWIAWFGVNTASRVYIAKENSNINKQNDIIKSAIILRLIISFIALVVLFIFAPALSKIFGNSDKYPQLACLLMLGSVLVFFNSFSEFFKELFVGIVDFQKIFVISIIEYGGYFIFGIGFLLVSTNFEFNCEPVIMLEIGYILSVFCVTLYGFIILVRKRVDIFFRAKIKKTYMLCILKYSIPILVTSFGAMLLMEIDTIMIGQFYPESEVAVYSVAKKLCTKAAHVNLALCTGAMPIFAVLNKDNISEKKKTFKNVLWVNALLTAGVVGAFWFLGPTFITVLYGSEYGEAQWILKVLMGYYILSGFSNLFGALLDYQEKAKTRSICYIVMIILNITLNYILIPRYGALGAAYATSISVIPYLVLLIFSSIRIFKRIK